MSSYFIKFEGSANAPYVKVKDVLSSSFGFQSSKWNQAAANSPPTGVSTACQAAHRWPGDTGRRGRWGTADENIKAQVIYQ